MGRLGSRIGAGGAGDKGRRHARRHVLGAPQADPGHPGGTVVAAIDQYVSKTAIIIKTIQGKTMVTGSMAAVFRSTISDSRGCNNFEIRIARAKIATDNRRKQMQIQTVKGNGKGQCADNCGKSGGKQGNTGKYLVERQEENREIIMEKHWENQLAIS